MVKMPKPMLKFEFGGWHWVAQLTPSAPRGVQVRLDRALHTEQEPFRGSYNYGGYGLSYYSEFVGMSYADEMTLRDRIKRWMIDGGEARE
jgi:hypothetical protein